MDETSDVLQFPHERGQIIKTFKTKIQTRLNGTRDG